MFENKFFHKNYYFFLNQHEYVRKQYLLLFPFSYVLKRLSTIKFEKNRGVSHVLFSSQNKLITHFDIYEFEIKILAWMAMKSFITVMFRRKNHALPVGNL